MAGRTVKAAAALKIGGQKVKATAAKAYALARDPEVQAKAGELFEDGKKLYRAAISPEAKEAYRQAAEVINKLRKK